MHSAIQHGRIVNAFLIILDLMKSLPYIFSLLNYSNIFKLTGQVGCDLLTHTTNSSWCFLLALKCGVNQGSALQREHGNTLAVPRDAQG